MIDLSTTTQARWTRLLETALRRHFFCFKFILSLATKLRCFVWWHQKLCIFWYILIKWCILISLHNIFATYGVAQKVNVVINTYLLRWWLEPLCQETRNIYIGSAFIHGPPKTILKLSLISRSFYMWHSRKISSQWFLRKYYNYLYSKMLTW